MRWKIIVIIDNVGHSRDRIVLHRDTEAHADALIGIIMAKFKAAFRGTADNDGHVEIVDDEKEIWLFNIRNITKVHFKKRPVDSNGKEIN